jgi:hypothetical protein
VGNGKLLVATSAWPNWEGGTAPYGNDGLAFLSYDNGRSWTNIVRTIRVGASPLTAFEQAFTRLSDGRLLAICWSYNQARQQNDCNRFALSSEGTEFDEPRETPLAGETSRPLGLDDNRLLIVYRRTDKPGLWAQLAVIEGDRWINIDDLPLWTGSQLPMPSSGQGNIESLSKLKFGCPAVLKRRNGEVFIVFWCVEECVSVIRWIRLRLPA